MEYWNEFMSTVKPDANGWSIFNQGNSSSIFKMMTRRGRMNEVSELDLTLIVPSSYWRDIIQKAIPFPRKSCYN